MDNGFDHIKWFRDASPFINSHRQKTFLLYLGSQALQSENLTNIIRDIALLNSLGIKLVIVHGWAGLLQQSTASIEDNAWSKFLDAIIVPEILDSCINLISGTQGRLLAQLSAGTPNSSMYRSDLIVTTGNFIRARPKGIINGIDHHHSGRVRKINRTALTQQLDNPAIVLISPIGYSLTGETFILDPRDLAAEVAAVLKADKLIFFVAKDGLMDDQGKLISEIMSNELTADLNAIEQPILHVARRAIEQGVERCHLIGFKKDGALLQELFTREGSGTQVVRHSSIRVRQATASDIPGIIALIEPLEQAGYLVKRSRELLESEVNHFTVIEQSGVVVSCAAIYPYQDMAELACLATHADYRDRELGDLLLEAVTNQIRMKAIKKMFVLTTQTDHWFIERGFSAESLDSLPENKRAYYNYQRNSKLLTKVL
ncbi:MAG: amino-acid N-acetyltransferase [Pseudomonadales bacterium]|jgi:amino-acid N-acetyltransferase|nr:amino-acid N-acetyltransferase [Pseudomonadales bacterium]